MSTHAPRPLDEDVLDRVFRALADRTRRGLLDVLADGPRTISELAAPYEISLPAVSKHLRVLEDAGLVQRVVDGRARRCSLVPRGLEGAEGWLDRRRTLWGEALDALARHVEADGEGARAAGDDG